MPIKRVYVEPGDLIEVRLCNPESGLGANMQGWRWSTRPSSFLIGIVPFGIAVPFDINVYEALGLKRQYLVKL